MVEMNILRLKKVLRYFIRFSGFLFVLVTLTSTIMGFWVLWKDNATTLPYRRPSSSISRQGDITTVSREETLSVKNYLPLVKHVEFGFRGMEFIQTPDGVSSIDPPHTTYLRDLTDLEEYSHFARTYDFYNYSQVVCEYNDIVIEELRIRHLYGDEALDEPEIKIQPKEAWYREYIRPFSDVLIDFKWSYSYNETEVSLISRAHTSREVIRRWIFFTWELSTTMPKGLSRFNQISHFIFREGPYTWWKIPPLISFFLLGVALANVNSKRIEPLSNSFNFITKIQNQDISDDIKSELKKELDTLAYRPHLLFSRGGDIIVGPAFSFFLISVRSKLNTLRCRCKLETLELSKDIENFLKDNATSTSTTFFNARSLTLLLGFLASIGFSFNWNVGIIKPIILTIGIIYLCLNLGFLSFIIRKSKWDLTYSLLLFLIFLFVMIMPGILPWLRVELMRLHI